MVATNSLQEIETTFHPTMWPKFDVAHRFPSPEIAVILAGGKGTRLMEKTHEIPKPMIKIGDKTLLEHIIDIYAYQGVHEFIIPVGYLKNYIFDYFIDVVFDYLFKDDKKSVTGRYNNNVITIVDTGDDTQTGGRIKRLQPYINKSFYLTYGDGVGNVNLHRVKLLHEKYDADVTLTAVHPIPRFGAIDLDGDKVIEFGEKTDYLDGYINGGFMVVSPSIFEMIDSDDTNLESDILPYLASVGNLYAYKHNDFWKCCDTVRDVVELENIYENEGAKWLKILG